jgi:ubiquinol-cytochrome c reductase cytochrome b subunit
VDDKKKLVVGTQKPMSLPTRLFRWLDKRTGVHDLMKESLDEPIPGGARLAYVFGSGLLFIFISQIITGICLALYYVPSAETAHTSVAYITKQVAAGAFLRSLHYYGSSAMIIVLALHFLQTFLYGSFKGRRELLWISGAFLSLLVLGMGFTGYLLPWDQKAYFATAVGTNIVGQIPLIGNWLTRLLRGGDTIGTLTLSRFYVAHVFLIPAGIFLFVAAHIVLFRKAGPAGPINEDPVEPKLAPEGFYPKQVLMDMAFALLIMVGLGFLSYFHPATLGPVANPADTLFLPRPEWYYLPMFEWLKYWEGPKVVFAVVVVPGILAALFFLLPFLDRSLERRPWRRPIPLLAVAFVVLGMIYLGAKSRMDDRRDPTTAAQIATQEEQEKAYSTEPFAPYSDTPGGSGPVASVTGPVNPLIAQGKGVFDAHGCSSCHGEGGKGSPVGIALVGVTAKFPGDQLPALLHNPDAKMKAGGMPAVDMSPSDMNALVAYMAVLGTAAANVPAAYSVQPPQGVPSVGTSKSGGSKEGGAAPGQAASAAAGKQMYQQRGCAACHGEAGVGGRAPAISPLIAKLSNSQVIELLHNPNAKMKTGGMAAVQATPEEVGSLVAYMRVLPPATGKQLPAEQVAVDAPASETPPANSPTAANASVPAATRGTATAPAIASSSAGRSLFVSQGCAACHGKVGEGTHFASSLIGSASKFPGDKLAALLHQPTVKMRAGGMPAVTLTGEPMAQLVGYLATLGTTPPPLAAATAGGKTAPSPSSGSAAPVAGNIVAGATPQPPKPVALSPEALVGQKLYVRNLCESCHGVGGLRGTVAAPALAGTASILPEPILENLMRHHTVQMKKGNMPATNMNASDMKALVAYVRSMPTPAEAQ